MCCRTKVLADLRISEKGEEEEHTETRPRIMPRARRGMTSAVNPKTEEEGMFEQVLRSLRWHVEELEEEDTMETMLQRRIQAMVEARASASDMDVRMESLMEPV